MGRFDSLKSDKEKDKDANPFKRGGKRKEKNEKGRDFSKMTGTMVLPGLNNNSEKKSGKYVAPGLRKKKSIIRNSTPSIKPMFKTEDKFREKKGDFPELGSANDFPDLMKINEKVEPEKSTSKWSNIVSEKDKLEPTEKPEEENTLGPVPPGCVRLRLDKKTRRTIIEHGPTTKEHRDFMSRMQHIRAAKAQNELNKRMLEYEEYNQMMYPNDYYVNSWEWDDHVHHQEWLRRIAEDDGHFDIASDYDSEEYYGDDY